MILVTKLGDIINFDNVISVSRHGGNIIAHTVTDQCMTLVSYTTTDEAKTALENIEEALVRDGHARIKFT